ncbi:MAG: sodium/solute symporter [Planctomycetota bacterium]|nr:sodium/solute symporter [Planctomycetota bacterium]
MGQLLTPFDLIVFVGSLIAVMAVGIWAGRKEDTAEDFYLAGRTTRWWGVAGSIFGSNVSANHIVGMMGVGFAVGFAQSHFEITAIAGLLLLCYGFLPVYRRLKIFTLSEYLGRRYNDASRLAYALIMVFIMVVVQMVPGFYIGSRSLNLLLKEGETCAATTQVSPQGEVVGITITRSGSGYSSAPTVTVAPPSAGEEALSASATATVQEGRVASITVTGGGSGYDPERPPGVVLAGGADFDATLSPGDVDPRWYKLGIVLLALVTGTYTIVGGLKAVIVTDVIQSLLLLGAGLVVAFFTFSQPEVNGWAGMMALDGARLAEEQRMHLYNPSSHPELPWTGVLSGLMVLHFFYWGTNQFIVQRALAARDDRQARLGIITAGFFKLLIPFFSIGTGIAAYYLFTERGMTVDQDAVFTKLLTELVAPVGFGLVGLVAAGMIGAILSSLDSMMNSAATIFTFDIYKRYMRPDASEKNLVWVGRLCIVASILGAASLTVFTSDPNSKASFFLYIAEHQGRLIAGVVVAFFLGMAWRRANAAGAIVSIVGGVVLSYVLPPLLDSYLANHPGARELWGERVNFLHTVFIAAVASVVLHVLVSLATSRGARGGGDPDLTWTGMGIFRPATLRRAALWIGISLAVFALLAVAMVAGWVPPVAAAWSAAAWTWSVFFATALRAVQGGLGPLALLREDRFWAALLAATAVFLMYYYY